MRRPDILRKSGAILVFTAVLSFGQVKPHPDDVNLSPEDVADQQNYDQSLRPQFHYTPIQGISEMPHQD